MVVGDGDNNGKQFQARALEEVHALAFDGARLRHACEEDYAFGYWFVRAIVKVHVGAAARDTGATGGRVLSRGGGKMNIGIIRERGAFDRRVALTPPVVRRLCSAGHAVWVETGAGDGAMYSDTEYLRAGAQIAYSPEEAIGRAELLAKIGAAHGAELNWCSPGMALLAFYHMAVADRAWWKRWRSEA